jgi:hypothetical protein
MFQNLELRVTFHILSLHAEMLLSIAPQSFGLLVLHRVALRSRLRCR